MIHVSFESPFFYAPGYYNEQNFERGQKYLHPSYTCTTPALKNLKKCSFDVQ